MLKVNALSLNLLLPFISILIFIMAIVIIFWQLNRREYRYLEETSFRNASWAQQQIQHALIHLQKSSYMAAQNLKNSYLQNPSQTFDQILSLHPEVVATAMVDSNGTIKSGTYQSSFLNSILHSANKNNFYQQQNLEIKPGSRLNYLFPLADNSNNINNFLNTSNALDQKVNHFSFNENFQRDQNHYCQQKKDCINAINSINSSNFINQPNNFPKQKTNKFRYPNYLFISSIVDKKYVAQNHKQSISLAKNIFELYKVNQNHFYSPVVYDSLKRANIILYTLIKTKHKQHYYLAHIISIERLLILYLPEQLATHFKISLVDIKGQELATTSYKSKLKQGPSFELPIYPFKQNLKIRIYAYQQHAPLTHDILTWLVIALSMLVLASLYFAWQRTRQVAAVQNALFAETAFRRAMENSVKIGCRIIDMQGHITYVNPAFCQMTGWQENELLGRQAPFPYWTENAKEQLLNEYFQTLNGKVPRDIYEMRIRRKDQSVFYACMHISPLVDASGKQKGWIGSLTDISESQRIREELSASHERFTKILDTIDAAISVKSLPDKQLLFANRYYKNQFAALSNQNWIDENLQLNSKIYHTKVKENARKNVVNTIKDVKEKTQESKTIYSDTTSNETKNQIGLLNFQLAQACTNHDHNKLHQLKLSYPKYPASKHLAEKHFPLKHPPISGEIFNKELSRWFAIRQQITQWVDGQNVQIQIATDITEQKTALDLSKQQEEKMQFTSRLTTMGEMASSLAHELNQPLAAIANYCAAAKTILNNEIKNIATSTTFNELLDKTAQQALRAGTIIKRIRAFAKRNEPKQQLSDISEICADAVGLAELDTHKLNIKIKQNIEKNLPQVWLDPLLIQQVIVNLLKNAAESMNCLLENNFAHRTNHTNDNKAANSVAYSTIHSPIHLPVHSSTRNQIKLEVKRFHQPEIFNQNHLQNHFQNNNQTAFFTKKELIKVAVYDAGPGIDQEQIERLFEPFYSTKKDGMGIGLNLCRSIIESHQGRLWVENLYDNNQQICGCVFKFVLPIYQE